MNNICGVCGNEKRYDEYHIICRRCDSCNNKHALKYYYNNKDKVLAKKRNFYHKNRLLNSFKYFIFDFNISIIIHV